MDARSPPAFGGRSAGYPARVLRLSSSLIAAAIAALALAACGGGGKSPQARTTAPKSSQTAPPGGQGIQVTVHTPSHDPVAGKNWPISVRVTHNSQPVSGTISYAFTYQGQVVARRSRYHFTHGTFHDSLNFPARAEGLPLAVQFVIDTRYGNRTVSHPIKVLPAKKG